MAKRYTVLVADRTSGAVRRFTLAVRPAAAALVAVLALPLLIGIGARWQTRAELHYLRTRTEALEIENANFRAATGQLTTQVWSLQRAVDDLVTRSAVPLDVRTAMARLPDSVRDQAFGPDARQVLAPARGGGVSASAAAASAPPPRDTHDVLRSLVGSLERKLAWARPSLDREAALAGATPSIWPSLGWLSSGYGYRRDPFTSRPATHLGIDITGRAGDPVRASADGLVRTAGWDGGYGTMVTVSHGFGMETRYAHLSRADVTPGVGVRRGDVIGRVGSSGRSTAAHLHYEVWINGRPIDPLSLLVSVRR